MEGKPHSIMIEKYQENQIIKRNSDIQVSGHINSIIFKKDKVFKRAKACEIEFYNWLYGPTSSEKMKELIELIPKFYGMQTIDENEYLIIENLKYNCEKANVMDCKLGKITWKKTHSQEKIERKKINNLMSTTDTFGFRIEGMIIRDNSGNRTDKLSKKDCFYLVKNKEDIKEYFKKFISVNNEIKRNALELIISQLKNLLEFFKNQNEKFFRASSIYFVIGKNNVFKVKLIDFANVEDSEGVFDSELIEALQQMLSIWESLSF